MPSEDLTDEELTELEGVGSVNSACARSMVTEIRRRRVESAALAAKHPYAPDRCPSCQWANTGLLNYGETGKPMWLCHGCAARALAARPGLSERERRGLADVRAAINRELYRAEVAGNRGSALYDGVPAAIAVIDRLLAPPPVDRSGKALLAAWEATAPARTASECDAGAAARPAAIDRSDERIEAPFTPPEIVALNVWQRRTDRHPFTCGDRGSNLHVDDGHDTGVLVATARGWLCPYCDYTQTWAHAFMARSDVSPPPAPAVGPDGAGADLRGAEERGMRRGFDIAADWWSHEGDGSSRDPDAEGHPSRIELRDAIAAIATAAPSSPAKRATVEEAMGSPDGYPGPWRVDQDWTYEVIAADGKLVAKCPTAAAADAIVEARNEYDSVDAELLAALRDKEDAEHRAPSSPAAGGVLTVAEALRDERGDRDGRRRDRVMRVESVYVGIGARIRKAREHRGVSQAALGDSLHPPLTRAAVSNMEAACQRVMLHVLLDIARVLDIPVILLLCERGRGRGR
jgi:hypothetical protein